MTPYIKIFQALAVANVEYLVAGGIALNLHQIVRMTVDLDLIVHLKKKNVETFVQVMQSLGFRPKVPVNPLDFADEEKRESWINEKGMIVFSFVNPNNPMELVDIFVREPQPFEELYQRRKDVAAFDTVIPIIGIRDLLALKEAAGRTKDQYDIILLKEKMDEDTNQ